MTLHTITLTTDQLRTLEMVLEDAHEATDDDATDREEFEEREAIKECEQVVALALAPGLADGREGTCTACDLPINRAERSYQDRSKGWFLHKECWRDLNDSSIERAQAPTERSGHAQDSHFALLQHRAGDARI